MYKLSIITTFYNASNYIFRTLENLKKMENKDIEFIFVNDGSTDNTLKILEEFKLKNKYVLNQENGGVSNARNNGLINAHGEYVLFLDGDDWLDEKIYKKTKKYLNLDNELIKFGLIFTDSSEYYKYNIIKKNKIFNNKNKKDLFLLFLKTSKLNSASNQIIKRDVILNNNIKFRENIKFAEDFDFNLKLFSFANKIILLEECYYYYYQNNNSTTKSLSYDNLIKCLDDALFVYVGMLKDCKDCFFEQDYKDIINRVYNEIKNCIIKLFYAEHISSKTIESLLNKNLFFDNNFLYLKNEMNRYKIKKNAIIDKVVLTKSRLNILIFIVLVKINKLRKKLKRRI